MPKKADRTVHRKAAEIRGKELRSTTLAVMMNIMTMYPARREMIPIVQNDTRESVEGVDDSFICRIIRKISVAMMRQALRAKLEIRSK